MLHRTATTQELIDHVRSYGPGRKMLVRHFTREVACRTARNGVRHVSRSRARVYIEGANVTTTLRGEKFELTASAAEFDGKTVVYDLRIKSDYLPA